MSVKCWLRGLALLVAAGSVFSICLAAQEDAPSVAEAARRARQQKQAAAKPAHVIDNDSLPHAPAAASAPTPTVPGSDAGPSAQAANSADSTGSDKSGSGELTGEQKSAKIAELKQQIVEKKQRVDLQKRELALAQDTYFSNPDHEHDRAGKDKLDALQADITQGEAELADLQSKLDGLGPVAEAKPAEPGEPAPPAQP